MQGVNRQRYWSLATRRDLMPEAQPELFWDDERALLRLESTAAPVAGEGTRVEARRRAAEPPVVTDIWGTWARLADDAIVTGREDEPEQAIWSVPAGQRVADMTWTEEGHLMLAVRTGASSGHLLWVDLLARFDPVMLTEEGFAPDRIAVSSSGGPVWLIDRARQTARLLAGTPVPDVLDTLPRSPAVFQPRPEMADPPRLEGPRAADLAGDEIIDACADASGDLLLLRWPAGRVSALLDRVSPYGTRSRVVLSGAVVPFSMTPLRGGQVALTVEGWPEARAYRIPEKDATEELVLRPLGTRYPLRGWNGGRFCGGAGEQAHYPVGGHTMPVRRLLALSTSSFHAAGESLLEVLDSGERGFVWHRLYLDAILAVGCSVEVLAAASDRRDDLESEPDGLQWHVHRFGRSAETPDGGAQGVWQGTASDRPWLPGPSGRSPVRDREGLFACLLQKGGAPEDTRIAGRYLRLKLRFAGDGATTPCVYALRAWGPRYSYRDRHLPELFTIRKGQGARGSDFLDRYLGLFESVLTQAESEIATAWRLANPDTIPADGLDWLASWLGVVPDGALGEAGKRKLIAAAARLAPWRGTLRGLSGMLDIASAGGVSAGRIVVVENFRMRRTFATILGADFDDRFDPLTRGTRANANSHLGPGFFLGSEDEKLLFALFRPEVLDHDLTDPEERRRAARQLDAFFEDSAHKVTVLVHEEADPDRRALLSAVLRREKPAHVVAQMHDAPGSLILGLTGLLGVETHIGSAYVQPPLRLGETPIGQARLRGTPSLDQRI